jgi:hypothetical protein
MRLIVRGDVAFCLAIEIEVNHRNIEEEVGQVGSADV